MRVIIRLQGFFDFLFGVPEQSIFIPDEQVAKITYFEDTY